MPTPIAPLRQPRTSGRPRRRVVAVAGATLSLVAGCGGSDERSSAVVARLEYATPFPPPGVPAGGAPVTVHVRALDADGAPVRGATIVWVTKYGGTAQPTSTRTDADGIASTSWTGGTQAGRVEVRASALGGVARDLTFELGVAPLGIARLTPTFHTPAAPPLVPGTGVLMIAYPTDRYGNALGPTRTRWRSSDPRVASVDSAGPSNFAGLRVLAPGTATITATMDSVSGSLTLTVGPVPAALLRRAAAPVP